ncbi:hypothetical protein MKX03_023932 [Papaver bracteatum]|nr:hypothetical protein MKX03_023932 [Papaver bracteatum]
MASLFGHMAKERNAILDHGEAQPAISCTGDNGSVSYLEQVASVIYETMVKVVPHLLFNGLAIDACLFLYLQNLKIIAFNDGRMDHDTRKYWTNICCHVLHRE